MREQSSAIKHNARQGKRCLCIRTGIAHQVCTCEEARLRHNESALKLQGMPCPPGTYAGLPTWHSAKKQHRGLTNLREASVLLRQRRLLALVAPQLLNKRVRLLLASGCGRGRPHHQPVRDDQVRQQAPQPRSLHACRCRSVLLRKQHAAFNLSFMWHWHAPCMWSATSPVTATDTPQYMPFAPSQNTVCLFLHAPDMQKHTWHTVWRQAFCSAKCSIPAKYMLFQALSDRRQSNSSGYAIPSACRSVLHSRPARSLQRRRDHRCATCDGRRESTSHQAPTTNSCRQQSSRSDVLSIEYKVAQHG